MIRDPLAQVVFALAAGKSAKRRYVRFKCWQLLFCSARASGISTLLGDFQEHEESPKHVRTCYAVSDCGLLGSRHANSSDCSGQCPGQPWAVSRTGRRAFAEVVSNPTPRAGPLLRVGEGGTFSEEIRRFSMARTSR